MGEPQRIDDARNRHRLADPEYLLSAFIEHCPDRFYVKDAQSRFVFASRSVAAGFGLADPAELVGKSDFDFFAAEYAETSLQDEQRIMTTREPVLGFEERMIWPDGSVTWDSTTQAPLFDEHGSVIGLFGISRDITDRKLAEERLAQQADELTRSNAELEHFAYIASHDLQEPLRMVASYTELLARRYRGKLGEDADEFIAYAVDGVNRMRGLINDLLTYSRAGNQPTHEPVDTGDVLDHALKNLQTAIADSGAIVAHETLPTVLGDAGQLAQVFQNLIGNAIKFRGERIPHVTVTAERDGDDWLFRIADNGIGIETEYATRIFLLFQRLHGRDAYPGSGIGLAVCKKIVERNGGRIWFESTPGEGTTFFFSLPAEVQPE